MNPSSIFLVQGNFSPVQIWPKQNIAFSLTVISFIINISIIQVLILIQCIKESQKRENN